MKRDLQQLIEVTRNQVCFKKFSQTNKQSGKVPHFQKTQGKAKFQYVSARRKDGSFYKKNDSLSLCDLQTRLRVSLSPSCVTSYKQRKKNQCFCSDDQQNSNTNINFFFLGSISYCSMIFSTVTRVLFNSIFSPSANSMNCQTYSVLEDSRE